MSLFQFCPQLLIPYFILIQYPIQLIIIIFAHPNFHPRNPRSPAITKIPLQLHPLKNTLNLKIDLLEYILQWVFWSQFMILCFLISTNTDTDTMRADKLCDKFREYLQWATKEIFLLLVFFADEEVCQILFEI